jgi:pimeloyl-ACP methyl ester carboxylesterase
MTRVMAIHGVRNYKNGDAPASENRRIAGIWRAAIVPHLPDGYMIDLSAAYYADLVSAGTQGADMTGESMDHVAAIEDLLASWSATWRVMEDRTQGRPAIPLRYLANWIAAKAGSGVDAQFVERAARMFFPEVARYLGYLQDRRPCRAAVRARVAEALVAHQPEIVIAHSLGTVVAYEVLHAHPDAGVDLLITLGSPLALPGAIFGKLDPAPVNGLGQKPPGVRRWVDLADVGDVIAVPKGALPLAFTDVDAHYEIDIGPVSFHDVTKYLAHRQLISALLDQ